MGDVLPRHLDGHQDAPHRLHQGSAPLISERPKLLVVVEDGEKAQGQTFRRRAACAGSRALIRSALTLTSDALFIAFSLAKSEALPPETRNAKHYIQRLRSNPFLASGIVAWLWTDPRPSSSSSWLKVDPSDWWPVQFLKILPRFA